MKRMKTQVVVVMVLGIVALIAGFFAHLSLTDIYHGESNASLEWKTVQLSALIILLFIGSSLFTLGRALKALST
jgi:hypothetical protein